MQSHRFAICLLMLLGTAAAQNEDSFYKQQEECGKRLQEGAFTEAETSCKSLVTLAEKLPTGRPMERVTAYEYLGHAFFGQRKFTDALAAYQRELKIAKVALHPTDAELGYAYHDVARALHGMGELQQARSYYEQATATLEQARQHIDSAFLKNKYSATIKAVLQEEALLLQQAGDQNSADAMARKANSIVVNPDVKN